MAKKTQKKPETALVLRVCRADFSSYGGFVWPDEIGAEAVAPDWINNAECGNGLHGWLYGQGDHNCTSHWESADAKWMVLEVRRDEIVMLGGKCKFPRATVKFIGDKVGAASYVLEHEPHSRNVEVIGASIQVGDKQSVVVGALGTATAGYGGTATAGYRGTATAGNDGTATAGNRGTATAGYGGTATAGYGGEIRIRWWDTAAGRYRTEIAYVGENGIKADVPYRLNDNHQFAEA